MLRPLALAPNGHLPKNSHKGSRPNPNQPAKLRPPYTAHRMGPHPKLPKGFATKNPKPTCDAQAALPRAQNGRLLQRYPTLATTNYTLLASTDLTWAGRLLLSGGGLA